VEKSPFIRCHVTSTCFTSRNRHQESASKRLVVRQKICYHRGREEIVWGRLTLPPYNPKEALTRMVRTPDRYQYSAVAWESHRLLDDVSLHIAS